MKTAKQNAAARFKFLIDQTGELNRETAQSKRLSPAQALLASWQSARLGATYADYHTHRRYRAAIDFFLSDLYGPKDFSQRDRDIERVYPVMVKMLSAAAIESLTEAIELHALSMQLDRALLDVLVSDLDLDVSRKGAALTPELYAEAYRRCDNYSLRVQQIELAVGAGELLEQAVKSKMIYLTVKVARGPARLAGFGELQSFIERGLYAFKKMKGARRFLDALAEREMQVLNAIYDGEPAAQWVGDAVHGTVPVRG